jgi:hypothetical protein
MNCTAEKNNVGNMVNRKVTRIKRICIDCNPGFRVDDKKSFSGQRCRDRKSGENQVYHQRIQGQDRYSWHLLQLLFFPKHSLQICLQFKQ